MVRGEIAPGLSERAHRVYGRWALNHANEFLTVQGWDSGSPYQDLETTCFPARPNPERALFFGENGMGEAAYRKLADGYDDYNVLGIVRDNHENRRNTLITTLHLKYILDTAMTHNRLFTLSGNDSELAMINDVIINPMVMRLDILETPVIEVLSYSGNIDVALRGEGASKHGMLDADVRFWERYYGNTLGKRLGSRRLPGEGLAVHWSLLGTRSFNFLGSDGEVGKAIEKVEDGIANIAVKRMACVIPVPMDVEIGNCEVEVLKPRRLESVGDVHRTMEEMLEVASEMTGQKIHYGLPKGSQRQEINQDITLPAETPSVSSR